MKKRTITKRLGGEHCRYGILERSTTDRRVGKGGDGVGIMLSIWDFLRD